MRKLTAIMETTGYYSVVFGSRAAGLTVLLHKMTVSLRMKVNDSHDSAAPGHRAKILRAFADYLLCCCFLFFTVFNFIG